MHRRHSLSALAGLTSLVAAMTSTPLGSTAAATVLRSLRPSARMPVLFLGHGSPMNVISDNPWRGSWEALGRELLARQVQPQLILCVSAHWLTRGGWQLTGMAMPRTIHDFGGFPAALFAQQYPAPGAPEVARELAQSLRSPATGGALGVDLGEWGLDHGAWSVLKPMFPAAHIPVLQLSMDYGRAPAEHYALGQQLRGLRERGVLIVGSGNVVHNLRAVQRAVPDNQAYDWAHEFDGLVRTHIAEGNLGALHDLSTRGELAKLAHPSHEHYLPLLYAAGAVHEGESSRFFNEGFQLASISMRSVIWG